MSKYIIGTGCSWTVGEGAYTDSVWKLYNGRIHGRANNNIVEPLEKQHNWVSVLSRDYLTDHIPINLGKKGAGNRSAVKQLYFLDQVDWKNDEGVVVLMLSGPDRFDFMTGPNQTYTMWPYDRSTVKDSARSVLWNTFGEIVWTPTMAAMELFCNIREAEMFVAGTNFKLVIANAFYHESIPDTIRDLLGPDYYKKINWESFVQYKNKNCAFVYDFLEMDNVLSKKDWDDYHHLYCAMDWPQKYLTNDIHPTIDGYRYMAQCLYNFIKEIQ
jgi:lysophospholipase L1-like esterase